VEHRRRGAEAPGKVRAVGHHRASGAAESVARKNHAARDSIAGRTSVGGSLAIYRCWALDGRRSGSWPQARWHGAIIVPVHGSSVR
jgi:hypothetical protein